MTAARAAAGVLLRPVFCLMPLGGLDILFMMKPFKGKRADAL